ncbi:MAG: virulence-associated E family protein [Lachnospiraceae bacterium]|nr:virulence-associated E family protein [Lachnospiraceae bacterium]
MEEILMMSVEDIKNMLDTSEKGWPYNTIDNATIVFKNDSLFAGNIRENLFRERIELFGTMSWSRNKREITDKDEIHIIHYLEKNYRLNNERRIRAGMQIVATENEYHPIREYLRSLKWDGKERARYALPHFLGVENTEYQYEAIKLFMLGAIHRVFMPGCKFEYMLCLVGGQGAGKSTFIRFLATLDLWFTDDLKRMDDDKVYEHLAGHWICEIAEMLAILNTKYNEATKAFLSKQYDNYRLPYGTRAEDRPRQCVFAGTSNVQNFLPLDRSGNRRFLPIKCDATKAEVHILDNEVESRSYIEQMWAEMMHLYLQGNVKMKLPKHIEKDLAKYQQTFMAEDTWTGLIQDWLEKSSKEIVCVQQIYNETLNMLGKPSARDSREIGEIMNNMMEEWEAYPNPRNIPGYGKQRGWLRKVETETGNTATTFVQLELTNAECPFK